MHGVRPYPWVRPHVLLDHSRRAVRLDLIFVRLVADEVAAQVAGALDVAVQ